MLTRRLLDVQRTQMNELTEIQVGTETGQTQRDDFRRVEVERRLVKDVFRGNGDPIERRRDQLIETTMNSFEIFEVW